MKLTTFNNIVKELRETFTKEYNFNINRIGNDKIVLEMESKSGYVICRLDFNFTLVIRKNLAEMDVLYISADLVSYNNIDRSDAQNLIKNWEKLDSTI